MEVNIFLLIKRLQAASCGVDSNRRCSAQQAQFHEAAKGAIKEILAFDELLDVAIIVKYSVTRLLRPYGRTEPRSVERALKKDLEILFDRMELLSPTRRRRREWK